MKKAHVIRTLMIAGIVGLVAVPSIVSARHGADDLAGHIRQEDRGLRQEDKGASAQVAGSTQTNQTSESVIDGIKVENSVTLPTGAISFDEAKAIATGQFPTKTIVKVETEIEHSVVVYSFRFSDGSRVDVNVLDGAITRATDASAVAQTPNNSQDDDDDDEAEDQDDDRNRGSDSSTSTQVEQEHSGGDDDNSGSRNRGRH